MRRISVGRWRVARARELSLARLAVFQVSIPRQSRGFSFGATQSGFSLSLHSGISPLCEYLTKSEPLQLGKLRYCNLHFVCLNLHHHPSIELPFVC
jgi:hypothetical protein